MCGIAGIFDIGSAHADGRLVEAVKRMTDVQAHRGPDDAGFFIEHPVYLGHRRLSIIDVGGGQQPMYNEDGSVVVILNGEIYNYRELHDELAGRGHRFRTRSDTEVLVHLYEDLGADFIERISGMFALALWDRRAKRLILARDRMGQKPLHYAFDGRRLWFSTELRGLMQGRDEPWIVSGAAAARFMLYDAVPAPETILRDARKLGPGERLSLDAGGRLEIDRYWDIPYPSRHGLTTEADALAAFDQAFVPAIERHLLSDVPLGVFLSGGLDSTAVLHALGKVKPLSEIRTFAVGFEDPSFDESEHAAAVASAIGTDHAMERLTPTVMLDLIPDVVSLMDEPLGDPSFVPTYLLSRFTRRQVTVAVGGDGGDELFMGYPTYLAHRYAALASRVVPPPLAMLGHTLAQKLIPVSPNNISPDYQLKRFLKGLGYRDRWERHWVWIGAQPPDEQAPLFRPGRVPEGFFEGGIFEPIHRHVSTFPGRHELDLAAYLYAKIYLQDVILVKVDRASMAVSLEVRAPFLDPEVVAVAADIPPELKLKGRTTKHLLRRYLGDRVPPGIARRPKKGFGIPLSAWFKGPLEPFVRAALSPDRLDEAGLFDPAGIARLVEQHMSGQREHRKVLWNAAVLNGWILRHKDRVRV